MEQEDMKLLMDWFEENKEHKDRRHTAENMTLLLRMDNLSLNRSIENKVL